MSHNENPPKYKTPQAQKWFEKANLYTPKPDRDYTWVWEYAKTRMAWAKERIPDNERKALETIKLITASAGAAWAILVFFKINPTDLSLAVKIGMGFSFLLLLVSIGFALAAYLPSKRLLPVSEDAALRCADHYSTSSESMAKFSQTLSSAIEYEIEVAAIKSRKLWIAILCWSPAVIIFLVCLFLGVHH